MPILYHVQREEEGGVPVPLRAFASIDDAKAAIRSGNIPGRYVLYEYPTEEPPPWSGPPKWGQIILRPNGQLWTQSEAELPHGETVKRPMDFWREDRWSIYKLDKIINQWQLCRPDGQKLHCKIGIEPGTIEIGIEPDTIENVLAWADEEIAKIQRHPTIGDGE